MDRVEYRNHFEQMKLSEESRNRILNSILEGQKNELKPSEQKQLDQIANLVKGKNCDNTSYKSTDKTSNKTSIAKRFSQMPKLATVAATFAFILVAGISVNAATDGALEQAFFQFLHGITYHDGAVGEDKRFMDDEGYFVVETENGLYKFENNDGEGDVFEFQMSGTSISVSCDYLEDATDADKTKLLTEHFVNAFNPDLEKETSQPIRQQYIDQLTDLSQNAQKDYIKTAAQNAVDALKQQTN